MTKLKGAKPICIIPDTNIWRSTFLLRNPLGSALLYTVNMLGAKVVIPEVIEDETRKHILNFALEAIEDVNQGFITIGSIIGFHSKYDVPGKEAILAATDKRFEEISNILLRVPLTLHHAKNALYRVNGKIPPSSSKVQQFKDSAIWEAILEIGIEFDVHFITKDGDFYQNKERTALNIQLQSECDERGIKVFVYSEIGKCLVQLENIVPNPNLELIAHQIAKNISNIINKHALSIGLKLSDINKSKITPLITENHDTLAIEFEITLNCLDIESNNTEIKFNPAITVTGDCKYIISKNESVAERIYEINAVWNDDLGQETTRSQRFHYIHFDNSNQQLIRHRVRKEI